MRRRSTSHTFEVRIAAETAYRDWAKLIAASVAISIATALVEFAIWWWFMR
jgi:hypothetical protein